MGKCFLCRLFFHLISPSVQTETIWYWGGSDDYNLGPGTAPVSLPVKLNSPAGVKFVKLSCGDKLLALTDNGDVYEYTSGNPTPVKKVLPVRHLDIASGTGFQVAIVPDDIISWPNRLGLLRLGLCGNLPGHFWKYRYARGTKVRMGHQHTHQENYCKP